MKTSINIVKTKRGAILVNGERLRTRHRGGNPFSVNDKDAAKEILSIIWQILT